MTHPNRIGETEPWRQAGEEIMDSIFITSPAAETSPVTDIYRNKRNTFTDPPPPPAATPSYDRPPDADRDNTQNPFATPYEAGRACDATPLNAEPSKPFDRQAAMCRRNREYLDALAQMLLAPIDDAYL